MEHPEAIGLVTPVEMTVLNPYCNKACCHASQHLVHTASKTGVIPACVLQDARKGVLFDDFPPVLQLQLKRFEYDFQRDMMVKVTVCTVLSPQVGCGAAEGRLSMSQAVLALKCSVAACTGFLTKGLLCSLDLSCANLS